MLRPLCKRFIAAALCYKALNVYEVLKMRSQRTRTVCSILMHVKYDLQCFRALKYEI